MSEQSVAFHDLPQSKFPFTVNAYAEDSEIDENPLWTRTAEGPSTMLIPGVLETGQRVRLVIHYADGTVDRA